jgi:hypothetical protein
MHPPACREAGERRITKSNGDVGSEGAQLGDVLANCVLILLWKTEDIREVS